MDSDEVRRQWAERTGAYSPEYYAYHGADRRSEAVLELFERHVDREASVLELGCSSGRHLAHLAEHGYEDLSGIEVNEDAFDVMAEEYPDLAADGTFYLDAIEAVVGDFDDDQFDAVYSVETLQHVHPDAEWVFAEIARITGDLLVTIENEGGANERGEGERGEDEHGENGRAQNERGANERGESARGEDADQSVNYVHGEFPLYYRDWERMFTDLGLVQVEARAGERDTVRAFRSA